MVARRYPTYTAKNPAYDAECQGRPQKFWPRPNRPRPNWPPAPGANWIICFPSHLFYLLDLLFYYYYRQVIENNLILENYTNISINNCAMSLQCLINE